MVLPVIAAAAVRTATGAGARAAGKKIAQTVVSETASTVETKVAGKVGEQVIQRAISSAANDNFSGARNKSVTYDTPANDNRQAANDNKPRDIRTLQQRVDQANPSPGQFVGGAETNIAGGVKETIENQANVRPKNPNNTGPEQAENIQADMQEQQADAENQNFLNQQNFDYQNLPYLLQEQEEAKQKQEYIDLVVSGMAEKKINISEQEALDMYDVDFKVKFPFLVFIVSMFVELGDLILVLVGLVFIILLPISIMINAVAFLTGILISVVYFVWSNWYAKNASEYIRKNGVIKNYFIKLAFKRMWASVFKAIPIIGQAAPINSILIIYTYRHISKISNHSMQVVEEAKAKSGYIQ